MNVKINLGNITRCERGWHAPFFVRVHHCLLVLLEGEAHYEAQDEDIVLQPGHLYITPINKAYQITQNPEKLMNHLWIHFDGIYTLPNQMITVDLVNNKLMKSIIEVLCEMMRENMNLALIERQLGILVALLPHEKVEDIKIKWIIDYISNNYADRLTNKIIAKQLNIDVDYLGRLFKTQTGITLYKYIEKYKIEKACILLLENKKVEWVAEEVGYEDAKSFSRAFKRNKGITIKQYKESRFLQP